MFLKQNTAGPGLPSLGILVLVLCNLPLQKVVRVLLTPTRFEDHCAIQQLRTLHIVGNEQNVYNEWMA